MNNSENRLERKCSCCGGDNPEKQRIDAILEKDALRTKQIAVK